MGKEYFTIYSEKCLRCKHLVHTAKKHFINCHFTKGNEHCPAKEVRIIVKGKITRYKTLIDNARLNRDPLKEARIWESISKETEDFKEMFYRNFG